MDAQQRGVRPYRDPLIVAAVAADRGVAEAQARVDRLQEALRQCVAHLPEDKGRQRSLIYAHKAAVLRRNDLIEVWRCKFKARQ